MLTPRFTCKQDDEFLYIDIKVSHIRFDAPGVQIVVENELFVFALSPYYLRLRFSKPLIDDEERSNAHYESKEETIKVKIPKLNKGEAFESLDLPQKLLARAGEQQKEEVLDTKQLLQEIGIQTIDKGLIKESDNIIKEVQPQNQSMPMIEVIDEGVSDLEKTAQEGDVFNWEIQQTIEELNLMSHTKYGFNNQYESIIGVSISNGNDINDLDDPEQSTPESRIKERLLKENSKFDPEYYAADFMTTKYSNEDEYSVIPDLIKFENPLLSTTELKFTEEENNKMLDLPKKLHLISNPKPLYYTILSLLFSYSFEMRETEGELNTESAWSIGKLTPQISSLDQQIILPDVNFPIIKAIIITSIRRSLAYPLHRNFELACKAWLDAVEILNKGKRAVLKGLLTLHELFRFHDIYYVYNKALLDDLISWVINDPRDTDFIFKSLSTELKRNLDMVKKNEIVFEQLNDEGDVDTSLNILEIEQIAEEMYKNQE